MTTSYNKDKHQILNVDEMLDVVGSYGKFQKLINLIFCIMTIPSFYQVMITYFAADDPKWRCAANSSLCHFNGSFENLDARRCSMQRSDWEYIRPKDYSIVTYFDVNCKDAWLMSLVSSIFFLGWVLGSFILGVICDTYGRKIVLTVSMTVVLVVGFLSTFMPNLYLFIACRFIIGFFLPGTNVQIFIIITEICGSKYRGAAGLSTFLCGVLSLSILGVKALVIPNWKHLQIACTVPYVFVFLFYKFIPESVRYLRVKGKTEELMLCFQRIAAWNGKDMPFNVEIKSVPHQTTTQHSNPMDLFRTFDIATKTSIQIFAMFATGCGYYGLYMAAGDLGGNMYRDYILISVSEIPVIFLSMYLVERFGRKRTSIIPMLIGSVSCILLAIIPKHGSLIIARVIVGMVGKCSVGSNMNTMSTWSSELYSTVLRGEAMGFFQAALRLGAAAAPWLDKELVKVHPAASYIFMAVMSLISFVFLHFLPETKGCAVEEETEAPENKLDILNLDNIEGICNIDYAVDVVTDQAVDEMELGNNSFTNPAYTNPALEATD